MEQYKKRTNCAICGNKDLHVILAYGEVPLAGDFPSKDELDVERKFNMDLVFCEKCGLLQTDSVIDADTLFKDYRYMSSVGLTKHFTSVAAILKERFKLNEDSIILEIGSNDGVLLKPMMDLGLNPIGIEPATNICKLAEEKGCNVINDYFSDEYAIGVDPDFDLIISNNCFAHIDDIHSIVRGVHKLLKPEGHFVIEVHYVKNLIEQLQYDNIYHEHLYYYSLTALYNLFAQYDMTIVDYDDLPIHSGSIRVTIMNSTPNLPTMVPKVRERLRIESSEGLTKLPYFQAFSKNVHDHIKTVKTELVKLKGEGYKIAGYGASGRANMLCNLADLGPDLIDYIVDESPERCGRFIAGKHIPIVTKQHLLDDKPDYIMIFAWNFSKMIIEKLEGNGFKYIIGFPALQIVNNYSELKDIVSI